MWKIATYNKIDPIINQILAKEDYEIASETPDANAIIVRSAKLHDYPFAENKNLLAIARAGAGTNNIPCDICAENGVVVFNTPGANSNAVAEMAICMIIMASRNIAPAITWVNEQKGQVEDLAAAVEKGKSQFVGNEISGKTLGLVGLGAIGLKVAAKASALGMKVYGYDPFYEGTHDFIEMSMNAEEMASHCDFLSLHLPTNDKTKGMFNTDFFAHVKEGVILVNTARAALVNTPDLLKALEEGKVGKYIVDFPDENTVGIDKITPVPHLGASSPESEFNCAVMAAEEMKEYLTTGNIYNSVNYPTISLPVTGAPRIAMTCKADADTAAILAVLGEITAQEIAVRGKVVYGIFELAAPLSTEAINTLLNCPDIIKCRIV